MLKIEDEIKIEISAIANGGEGIGRVDSFVVFVPYVALGDIVLVRICEVKKRFARANLIRIIKPSKDRTSPRCEVYYDSARKFNDRWCGGCNFMHIAYDKQLEYKENNIKDVISSLAKITDYKWEGIVASPKIFNYRNKVQLPITLGYRKNPCAGFYMPKSHEIVPVTSCKVQPKCLSPILKTFLKLLKEENIRIYNELVHKGGMRHFIGRCNKELDVVITFVMAQRVDQKIINIAEKLMGAYPNIKGVLHNYNPKKTNVILGDEFRLLCGEAILSETIGDIKYEISPGAFFQVNMYEVKNLYDGVKEYIEPSGKERVLDLYAGSGGLGVYLAKYVESVLGIELVKAAVEDAAKNAFLNGITNAAYHQGKVEDILNLIDSIDVIILNPPRTGLDPKVVPYLAKTGASKIIYVSCNPVTFARDLVRLGEIGYNLKKAKAYDMFPQTNKVEVVAQL